MRIRWDNICRRAFKMKMNIVIILQVWTLVLGKDWMAPKTLFTDTLWIWCLLVDITCCHIGGKSGQLFPLRDPHTPLCLPRPCQLQPWLLVEVLQGLSICCRAGEQLGLPWCLVHLGPESSCTEANRDKWTRSYVMFKLKDSWEITIQTSHLTHENLEP